MRRLRSFAAMGGLLAAALLGTWLGVMFGDRASQPDVRTLVVREPALAAEHAPVLRSPGGFTGVEGRPALGGRVFRIGSVEDRTDQSLTVASDGSTFTVRLLDTTRLFRIATLGDRLQPGDLVLVRFEGDAVTGVLRVPPDLHEGDARGAALVPGPASN